MHLQHGQVNGIGKFLAVDALLRFLQGRDALIARHYREQHQCQNGAGTKNKFGPGRKIKKPAHSSFLLDVYGCVCPALFTARPGSLNRASASSSVTVPSW